MAFGAGICAGGRYPANEPKWRRAQGAHTNDRTRPFPPSRRRRQALDFDREIDGGQPDVAANSRPALCVALSRVAREVCQFRRSPVRNAKRGKGEASAGRMCEFGRARLGARWEISSFLSVCYRQQARCPMRFLFPIFQIYAIPALGSPKGSERGRKRGGMDCGTALAKQARLNPCGEALRRRVFARPRAPAPAAEGRFRDERRLAIWIRP